MLSQSSGKGYVKRLHLPIASLILLMSWLVLNMALMPAVFAHVAAPTGPIISPTAASDLVGVEVSFYGGGGITLHGTILELAQAKTGRAGVVLVHGSGTGLLRTSLLVEATAFARQGLSVLIYDKRQVGYSDFQRSYALLADDALGAVRTLRAHVGVDPEKVGIWGLSEGGWVAPLAASRSADIAFVIVVGANAMEPLRQQTWAIANALHREGVSGSLITQAEPNMFRMLADAGLFAEAYYDGAAVLRQVRQPLLGIWGSDDRSTPPQENPPLIARALQQGGNTHYTFRFFPGADHAVHQSPDGGLTRLPLLAPGYAELVGSWTGDVTSARLPDADAPASPHQDWLSVPVPPSSWWEAAWIQFATFALLMAVFAAYPLVAIVRRMRGHVSQAPAGSSARLLAGAGAGAVLGFFVYITYLAMSGEPGPVLAGRPLLWLFLQALVLVTIGAGASTVVAWRRAGSSVSRGERLRLGLLLAGGALFVLWALYWGLLLP